MYICKVWSINWKKTTNSLIGLPFSSLPLTLFHWQIFVVCNIPVKLFLGLVFWPFHVNLTFCPVMQRISGFNKNSPLFDFQHLYFIPACDWTQLPYLVIRHALEFSTRLDLSGCVELLQRLQLEINSLNSKKRNLWSNQFE